MSIWEKAVTARHVLPSAAGANHGRGNWPCLPHPTHLPGGFLPLSFSMSFFRADGSVAWGRRDGICSGSLLLHVNSFELSVNRTIVLRPGRSGSSDIPLDSNPDSSIYQQGGPQKAT